MMQTKVFIKMTDLASKEADAAALGVLVKMSARKYMLIRVIETILRPLVVGLEWLRRPPRNANGEVNKILVMEYWNFGRHRDAIAFS